MAKRSTALRDGLARARRDGWARWIRSEADERAVAAGMVFHPRRVDRVRIFGERNLRFWEGPAAGLPFVWQTWQHDDLFGPLYGWIKYSTFYKRWVRRFDRVYCEVAKKNGKSPTAAYVGLNGLCNDDEPGARIFSTATTKEQAQIVHTHAVNMALASPRLLDLVKINRTTATIGCPTNSGIYRALSSLAEAAEGLNASIIIADELHAWKFRALWDALKWAFASRAQPILFSITTAGENTDSVCYEQHTYARAVNRGDIVDLGFLGLIYAPDDDDRDDDPRAWRKANPSLGVTIDPERFAADYKEASAAATTLAAFRRYRLNRWGAAATNWLRRSHWDKCGDDYTADDLRGKACWLALDLAPVDDLSAIVATFPEEMPAEQAAAVRADNVARSPRQADEPATNPEPAQAQGTAPQFTPLPLITTRSLAWHFLPEATAEEFRKQIPIDDFVARGELILTPGDVTDYGFIFATIADLVAKFDCRELAFDPYDAEQLTAQIEAELGLPRAEFRQTWANFAEPTATVERMIIARTLRHPRNRLLSWQAGHVSAKTDANGNRRPVKRKRGDVKKVDGIIALVMAHARALANYRDQWPDASDYDVIIG